VQREFPELRKLITENCSSHLVAKIDGQAFLAITSYAAQMPLAPNTPPARCEPDPHPDPAFNPCANSNPSPDPKAPWCMPWCRCCERGGRKGLATARSARVPGRKSPCRVSVLCCGLHSTGVHPEPPLRGVALRGAGWNQRMMMSTSCSRSSSAPVGSLCATGGCADTSSPFIAAFHRRRSNWDSFTTRSSLTRSPAARRIRWWRLHHLPPLPPPPLFVVSEREDVHNEWLLPEPDNSDDEGQTMENRQFNALLQNGQALFRQVFNGARAAMRLLPHPPPARHATDKPYGVRCATQTSRTRRTRRAQLIC
jgi:hypothetical protein